MLCSTKVDHIAASANRAANCIDINLCDVVAYGCSNSVILYKLVSDDDVHRAMTFNYHKGSVTSLKWIRCFGESFSKGTYLLSGSVDKKIVCWKAEKDVVNSLPSLNIIKVLEGHKGSITSLDGICAQMPANKKYDSAYLIASASSDSTVKIWQSSSNMSDLSCVQTLDFGHGFVLGIALHLLPNHNVPVLACACDDFNVKLYSLCDISNSEATGQFMCVITLKGHEDWVRGVAFANIDNTLLLASCSQDCFIRLWKISEMDSVFDENNCDGLNLKTKQHVFSIPSFCDKLQYTATLDAVLSGHENWVHSVYWQFEGGKQADVQQLKLLSASMDKTVVVWHYDANSATWVDKVRMGEVGGNSMGFFSALFSNNGKKILAHAFSGAFHAWNFISDGEWIPSVVVGGHSSSVNDIDWEPQLGRFLISTSEDQTTRLFAEWPCSNHPSHSWFEIARPQIHGYNLQCLKMLTSTEFISGADEKVLRVFKASQNFTDNLKNLCGYDVKMTADDAAPIGASVPALGLSNKAVFFTSNSGEKVEEKHRNEQYIENMFSSVICSKPPPETHLQQNTLWPEICKLYHHVYEIFSVACNNTKTLVASAAKSSQPMHSGIVLWDVSSWQKVGVLMGHKLTVTQMEFSPNDCYLLSVSRDRTWILHSVNYTDNNLSTSIVAQSDKKLCHARIIWSCSWSNDSLYFGTASRDKKIMMWQLKTEDTVFVSRKCVEDLKESVTAIAFLDKKLQSANYVFAVGLESGKIHVVVVNVLNKWNMRVVLSLDSNLSHCLSIKRLRWRPNAHVAVDNGWKLYLASCGMDNQIKFFKIYLSL